MRHVERYIRRRRNQDFLEVLVYRGKIRKDGVTKGIARQR
ncbi:hypothetical protein UABAM_03182 [Candidatus Uabimicrobium amorphum]|uniref:Uncharacterized protein n=1 Tax=Uabimicrobium amorphum TaxID=2596890 RepID=A0A5S9IP09_UABAM|nr:hypothetical protein UABAM_03182 [Candidatus Uabimicrobium amorphum]